MKLHTAQENADDIENIFLGTVGGLTVTPMDDLGGRSTLEVYLALRELPKPRNVEEVESILKKDNFTKFDCSECKKVVRDLVSVTSPNTPLCAFLCRDCVWKALKLLEESRP